MLWKVTQRQTVNGSRWRPARTARVLNVTVTRSLVRRSLLLFLLSHMAVHHLHHLHYHRLYLLLLAQYFILNSRLGSSANPFLHRPFPFLPDWLHGLSYHVTMLLCSTAVLVSVLDSWSVFECTLNHCTFIFISFHFITPVPSCPEYFLAPYC